MKTLVLSRKVNVLLFCNFLKTTALYAGNDNYEIDANNRRGYSVVSLAHSSYKPTSLQSHELSAPPIVILHGILGSKSNWNSLSKVIAEKCKTQVFSLDARNHGESPHSDEFTYNHMVEDTVEFLCRMNIKKATLIGHSMGGKTSMLLSLLHPELVESLVVVDISPKGMSSGYNSITQYVKEMMNISLTGSNLRQVRKHAGECLNKVTRNPAIDQFLLTNLVEDQSKNIKWRVNLNTIYNSFNHIGEFSCDIGKSYEGPTLFIGGGNSDYIKKGDHELINKLFPASEVKYISGAGHWVHSEKPNDFLNMACEFINKHKSTET